MSKCYLAGPMRGIPEYNYPAFMAGATKLRKLGWEVWNPAEMDMEEDAEDYAERTLEEQRLHDTAAAARRFARRDTHVLLNLLKAEDGDQVFVLPYWEGSQGAIAETNVARWVMLPIVEIADAAKPTRGA